MFGNHFKRIPWYSSAVIHITYVFFTSGNLHHDSNSSVYHIVLCIVYGWWWHWHMTWMAWQMANGNIVQLLLVFVLDDNISIWEHWRESSYLCHWAFPRNHRNLKPTCPVFFNNSTSDVISNHCCYLLVAINAMVFCNYSNS